MESGTETVVSYRRGTCASYERREHGRRDQDRRRMSCRTDRTICLRYPGRVLSGHLLAGPEHAELARIEGLSENHSQQDKHAGQHSRETGSARSLRWGGTVHQRR